MSDKTYFIDTGAWFAITDKSDQYHDKAIKIFENLIKNYNYFTTSNYVISETYTLIRKTIGHEEAIMFLNNIEASPRVTKIYSNSDLEETAEKILRKYSDQDFSYVDAVSFSVMRHYEIDSAFAFDKHFKIAGFIVIP